MGPLLNRLSLRRSRTTDRPIRSTVSRAASLIALVALTLPVHAAHAAGGGAAMPWDGPLNSLVNNLTGPTVRALVIVAIVAAGLLWAFTRHEEGLKRLGQIAFGGAIAMGAVTMMASLGFAGAAF
jgi:type IV secretion system protein VirB2